MTVASSRATLSPSIESFTWPASALHDIGSTGQAHDGNAAMPLQPAVVAIAGAHFAEKASLKGEGVGVQI